MIRRSSIKLQLSSRSHQYLEQDSESEHPSPRKNFQLKLLPTLDLTHQSGEWQLKKAKTSSRNLDQDAQSPSDPSSMSPTFIYKKKYRSIQIDSNQFGPPISRPFQKAFTVRSSLKCSGFALKTQRDDSRNGNIIKLSNTPHQTLNSCPFSQRKSVGDIINNYMEKNQKQKIIRYNEFEKQEELVKQTKQFSKMLQNDNIVGPVIGEIHEMKGVVKTLIDLSNGNKLVYHYEVLKQLHEHLEINDEMFNRFKYLYVKQLISMKVNVDMIFRCAQIVEAYRGAITSQERSLQDVKDSLKIIARFMYSQIFEDFSLSPLFKGTKQEEQALKFSKIFGFIVGSSEQTNYVMDSMRDFHRGFEISSVQYSIFKYYLSKSLARHTKKEVIWYVLEQTDAYKAAVINQDSIKNLVYRQYGIDNFQHDFIKLCQADHYINRNFISKIGLDQFIQHSKFFLTYIFNKQNNCFTLQDLNVLHCQHGITQQLYKSIKDKVMFLIQKLNPQRVIFEDFEEEYDLIHPYITNQKLPFEIVGENRLQEMIPMMSEEICQHFEIKRILDSNDVDPNLLLLKKFEYILSGRKYFKRSDIQAIHSRLRISENAFDEFHSSIEKVIQHYYPGLLWMAEAMKQWKYVIITE